MKQKNISSKEFYELIVSSDKAAINKVSSSLIRRISQYLKVVLGADDETAKDCAQQAFENVYTGILENALPDIDDLYGYLIRSSKNEYLMTMRREKFEVSSEYEYFLGMQGANAQEVVKSLHSKQREKLLKHCVEKLSERRFTFFKQLLKHINEKDADAAEKLNMTHGSFRTKKSRLIESLRDCINKSKIE